MKFTATTAILAMLGAAMAANDSRRFAVLRFTNKALVQARADPIVSKGAIAAHAHNVLGGSNFGLSSTGQDLLNSNCSTAMIKGDNSNYWYPMLYFQDPKTGLLEAVEVFYTNVYYFFEPTNDKITAFPVGLQMVSGNANTRTPPAFGAGSNLDPSKGPLQPIKFTCPRSNMDQPAWPPNSNGTMAGMQDPGNKGEGVGFPDVNCDGYASPLRMDIHFPSCYNPQAGLTNYKENMAYPTDAGNGKADCPKGWEHTASLFVEVYFNTPLFAGRWEQGKGTQPFVLSNGDATGYSAHADFMAGWDEKLLQHIIDTCNAGSSGMDKCPGLFYGLNHDDCTIPSPVPEDLTGPMKALAGNNPITGWGRGSAPPPNPPNPPSSPSSSPTKATPSQPPASSKPAATPSNSAPGYPLPPPPATSKSPQPSSAQNSWVQPSDSKTAESQPTNVKPSDSKPTGSKPTYPAPVSSDAACTPKIHTTIETVTVTAGAPAPTGAPDNNSNTIAGFKLAGCFKDNIGRVLTGETLPNLGPMSNEKCINHCKAGGFALAATEYGGQCFCGNQLVGSAKLDDSVCNMKCEGDAKDVCGGSWALSVYSQDGQASLKSAKVRRAAEHLHMHRAHRY